MCSCHSILECCVMFPGVKLSIRSFVLFIIIIGAISCYRTRHTSSGAPVKISEIYFSASRMIQIVQLKVTCCGTWQLFFYFFLTVSKQKSKVRLISEILEFSYLADSNVT